MKMTKTTWTELQASFKKNADASVTAGIRKSASPRIETKPDYVSITKFLRGGIFGNWDKADTELRLFKAYNSTVGTQGGFFTPPQLSSEVIELLKAQSVVRNMPGVRQISLGQFRSLEMNRIDAGPSVSWGDENTTIASDTTMSFGQVKLELNKAVCLVPLSREVIKAANPSIDSLVKQELAEYISLAEDLAFLEGTGGTQPLGFYYNPQILNTDLSASITYDNVMDAEYQVEAQNGQITGWVTHPRTKNTLRQLKDANGRYLWTEGTPTGSGGLAMPALGGKPVAYSTQIPATLRPGSNETFMVGGQWDNLLIGDGEMLRIETSTEAGNAFALDQVWIKAVKETDCALRHPTTFVRIVGIQA